MNRDTTAEQAASEGPSAATLKAAREAVAALATAAKSFTLYPTGHVMAQKQISTLDQALAHFFEAAPELHLEISREGLTYHGNRLYQPLPADDPLLPPLLRDGFLWIAFQKGVDQHQLAFFLEVVNRYRILVDEPEGDLVTELWQADLKQIRYEAVEEFWDVKPQFDFSHFRVWPDEDIAGLEGPPESAPSNEAQEPDEPSESIADGGTPAGRCRATVQIERSATRRDLLRLSEKEKAQLQNQIEALETKDNTAVVRQILLFTLAQQTEITDFKQFLEVLHDLLFDQLYHRQAGHFHELLRGVRLLQKNTRIDWQRKAVNDFINRLSSHSAWTGHTQFFGELYTLTATEQQHTTRFIHLMSPAFIAVLAPELNRVRGTVLHQKLVVAAAKLASRNFQVLERCISGSDEATLRQVVMILGEMSGERVEALLKRLGRHPSGAVRETAVKTMLAKTATPMELLAHYLADSHPGVRTAALDYISRTRDPSAEAVLRNYIQNDPTVEQDDDHLIACYKALGRCGSQATIPFLEACLLNRSGGGLLQFGGNVHRLGAAVALRQCPGERAKQILAKAAKSLFPAIRKASRKALAT